VSEDEIQIICFLLIRDCMERREEKKRKERNKKRNETKRKETKAEPPCKKLKLGVTTIFFVVVVVCYFLSVTLFYSPKHNVYFLFLFFSLSLVLFTSVLLNCRRKRNDRFTYPFGVHFLHFLPQFLLQGRFRR